MNTINNNGQRAPMAVDAVANKVVMCTGHRPAKLANALFGNGYDQRNFTLLVDLAVQVLKSVKPTEVISGMALGWDMAVARAANILDIPVTAAIPFKGQENRWPRESRDMYDTLLRAATRVYVVSPGEYAAAKMHKRNQWMVDHADQIISLYNGDLEGGTYQCLMYASDRKVPSLNCWAAWHRLLGRIALNESPDEAVAALAAEQALKPSVPLIQSEEFDENTACDWSQQEAEAHYAAEQMLTEAEQAEQQHPVE